MKNSKTDMALPDSYPQGEIIKKTKQEFDELLKVALQESYSLESECEDFTNGKSEDIHLNNSLIETDRRTRNEPSTEIRNITPDGSPASNRTYEVSSPKIIKERDWNEINRCTKKERSNISNDSNKSSIQENLNNQSVAKNLIIDNSPTVVSKLAINEDKKVSNGSSSFEDKNPVLYKNMLKITVHKADCLKFSLYIKQPVVAIHLVDSQTGQPIKQSYKCGTAEYVVEHKIAEDINFLYTHSYDLRQNRLLLPMWEESLIINNDIETVLEKGNTIIIFFDILDRIWQRTETVTKEYRIAWAYLKLSGSCDILNTKRRLRLQLYEPSSGECSLYSMWSNKYLNKYPSALHVSLKYFVSSRQSENAVSNKLSNKYKKHFVSITEKLYTNNLSGKGLKDIAQHMHKKIIQMKSSADHSFKLCEKHFAEVFSSGEGSMVIKFSRQGLLLAATTMMNDINAVTVYVVDTLQKYSTIPLHQGLIYSICWSFDDKMIITASSDGTVALSCVRKNTILQMLPHPSFVYTSEISSQSVVATGCYDKVVRVWNTKPEENILELQQELSGHGGYVTSVCFSRNGDLLFSSDALGLIIEWFCNKNKWELQRCIKLTELHNKIINQILLHKKEKKLLVHTRDNLLYIMNIKTTTVLQRIWSATNKSIKTIASFSPCGDFVTCGSETGIIQIWNTVSGKSVATFSPYNNIENSFSVNAVEFHPLYSILAVSHYGTSLPIYFYRYFMDINDGNK